MLQVPKLLKKVRRQGHVVGAGNDGNCAISGIARLICVDIGCHCKHTDSLRLYLNALRLSYGRSLEEHEREAV